MKRFSILTQTLVITLILSACGGAPQATPTVNLTDLESMAFAAASTLVAQTQAAAPTATPLPPTTTATLLPIPTVGPTLTPLPAGTVVFTPTLDGSSIPTDPCVNQVLPASLPGLKIKMRIDNPTKGSIMVSVNLQPTVPQGICGYRGYTLTAGESLVITDLVEGCYSIWAWNPDPKEYFMVTNGTSCLNTSNSWTFDISTNSIKLRE